MSSDFNAQLMYLAHMSNKSLNQIEREMNYPRNALNNYKGDRSPSATRLVELSYYFGVTPEFMLGMDLDGKQSNIERLFKSFRNEEKREIFRLSSEWYSKQNE